VWVAATSSPRPRRASATLKNVTLASLAKEPRFRRGQGSRFAWIGVRDEDGPVAGDIDQSRMPAETGSSPQTSSRGRVNRTRRQNEDRERPRRDRAERGGGAGRSTRGAGHGPTAAERPDQRPPPAACDRRRRSAAAGLGQRPLPLPLHAALLPARPLPAGHPRPPGLPR
jgi:hypothetical protein